MPVGVPVSVSDFREFRDENGNCKWFWEAHPEKERLNLNTATYEELVGLGLSKSKALRIVEVREIRGGFRSVADLMMLRGIGKGTYEKVCDMLYVEEPKPEPVVDEQQREWMLRISDATEWIAGFLNKTFGRLWCKLRFEHVDAAAYWYTFELVNDDRRQTWCVRHSDLEG
jgi:competence protein ComEA